MEFDIALDNLRISWSMRHCPNFLRGARGCLSGYLGVTIQSYFLAETTEIEVLGGQGVHLLFDIVWVGVLGSAGVAGGLWTLQTLGEVLGVSLFRVFAGYSRRWFELDICLYVRWPE